MDSSQPVGRRVTSLWGALEHFRIFGFDATRAALENATGVVSGKWNAAQLDLAARLVADAHSSWAEFARASMDAARTSKRAGEPARRPGHQELLVSWRREYFDDTRAAQWHVQQLVDSLEP
jgi:hypothetical protein